MQIKEFNSFCGRLMQKHNLNSVIISDSENVYLLLKNGILRKIDTELNLNTIGKHYARMKGNTNIPFVFLGMIYLINNISRMMFSTKGLKF
ncbi:MAG: hypothetical protein R2771_11660 [Saprospiraceae bacterium]